MSALQKKKKKNIYINERMEGATFLFLHDTDVQLRPFQLLGVNGDGEHTPLKRIQSQK